MSTTMTESPRPGIGRHFIVEASYSNPTVRHSREGNNLSGIESHATRTATNQRTHYVLQRGYWVEVYDEETRELLAGPFDPDQAAPAYIV